MKKYNTGILFQVFFFFSPPQFFKTQILHKEINF